MALQPLCLGLGRFSSFLILYTVDRIPRTSHDSSIRMYNFWSLQ
jgi:hypothetical protein